MRIFHNLQEKLDGAILFGEECDDQDFMKVLFNLQQTILQLSQDLCSFEPEIEFSLKAASRIEKFLSDNHYEY
jgi:hypothetical protein